MKIRGKNKNSFKRTGAGRSDMQVVCDFYNLRLKSGYFGGRVVYPEEMARLKFLGDECPDENAVYPDEDERNRVLDFFAKHCLLVFVSPDPMVLIPSMQEHPTPDLAQPSGISNTKRDWGPFSVYLYAKDPFYEISATSWFESEDYLDFATYWHNFKKLLDGIIDHKLDLGLFRWFATSVQQYFNEDSHHRSVKLKDPTGKIVYPNQISPDITVPLAGEGKWEVKESYDDQRSFCFGIEIGNLFRGLYSHVSHIMSNPQPLLRRCEAGATPRRPACQNILIHEIRPGPQRKWCSNSCKMRIYKHERKT